MRAGLIILTATYILSQFFRAFLAVLAPDLQAELGATEAQLSNAQGSWFLVFALMQLPIGWALDRIGPKLTTSVLVILGAGGGAMVFAAATAPWHLVLAMGLIGVGCAPMLMASFFLIARTYSAVVFSTYAGLVIAIGNLGNIGSSRPLAWALEAFGWRSTMVGLGAVTVLAGFLILLMVKNPPAPETEEKGSVLDLLKIPALWLIFAFLFVNYAPAASIRGLWIGPYLDQVFGASTAQIGNVTLLIGICMVLGSSMYGPMDRIFGTRKWVVFTGGAVGAVLCIALAAFGTNHIWLAAGLAAIIGITGTSFPVIVAHGKAMIPTHLTGRGVTLINMFGIGGVGIMQTLSGRVFEAYDTPGAAAAAPFNAVFIFFGLSLFAGLAIYLFSEDRLD